MNDFFTMIVGWINATQLPRQIQEVEVSGLFTNPYFMVPFVCMIGYLMYKQSVGLLVLLTVLMVGWVLSGTEYMQTLVVDGELQLKKVLPLMAGGVAIMGFLIWFLFMRSD